MNNLIIGEKVSIFKFTEFGADINLGSAHEVVRITKTQVHIRFQNNNSSKNGEIFKFNKSNNIRVGESKKKDAFYIMLQQPSL